MCRKIAGVGTCIFDELVRRLPTYSWAPVFSAMDHLQPARTPLGQMHARRRLCGYSSGRLFPFPGLRKTRSAKPYYLR
ncbi:MAG: hypothetical protein JSS38_10160 [Nitrospira sp.]|nr:hypothetical protein [Nitrospira sp.]